MIVHNKTNKVKVQGKPMTLDEQIEIIKSNLYKKIDVCFMKYGLRGLRKIDESIAEGLADFVAEEEEGEVSRKSVSNRQGTKTVSKKSKIAEKAKSTITNPILAMAAEVDLTSQATHSQETFTDTSAPMSMIDENDSALNIPTETNTIPVIEQSIQDPGINDMIEVDPDDPAMGMPTDNTPVETGFGNFDVSSIGAALQ